MSASLQRIVARLRDAGLLASEPSAAIEGRSVDKVTTDSRFVTPGTLFCAIRGTVSDGHAFLDGAAAAGAVAALVEFADPAVTIPQIVVSSSRKAAAFAAAELYGDPWKEVTLIGVTGTNGKTTTVSILRHLLSRSGPAASIGTLGVIGPDGGTIPGTEGLTTPGPSQFAEVVRHLADDGVRNVAMEVSSHALDQDRVSAATFAGAVFTNLSRDHLDYHGTIESYRRAKSRLVELIRPGGVIAANADDPSWEGLGRDGVHLVRFGAEGRGEVQAEGIEVAGIGMKWHLHTPSCTSPVEVPLLGMYNVYNALGAATLLWGLGWTADRIAEGLADLPQVPGRLERIPAAGCPILVDYAHTPDALERALRAVKPLVGGRVIVVFGAGGDRDRGKRPEMGRVASENADLTIVTTDNPRYEDPIEIAEQIEAGMTDSAHLRILDRREAIAHAIDIAGKDDLILLAGKGHETYQIWGDERRPFDERQVVREILQRKGGAQ